MIASDCFIVANEFQWLTLKKKKKIYLSYAIGNDVLLLFQGDLILIKSSSGFVHIISDETD